MLLFPSNKTNDLTDVFLYFNHSFSKHTRNYTRYLSYEEKSSNKLEKIYFRKEIGVKQLYKIGLKKIRKKMT